ncbi:succinyl-diaminopimelate desuccinylase [uncultured Sphingomonas sp.]|uniref:succinyl-diaminopimelate desuccinylase n=1 Tax=uncultured Sphingomonas sp. TaxID=158754 RepID=UPI0035C9907F
MNSLPLAQALLRAASVTPARGAAFDIAEDALLAQGFQVDRFVAGDAPDGPVENLIATRGDGGPHFAFAGHLDVVPPGPGWTGSPWSGEVRGGLLYGRGAVDMKGAVAAFIAAADRARAAAIGTLSLLLTGDEEGPATYGTRAIIDRMAQRGLRPDLCLVGEPTSARRLGDTVKIGRRGSVNIWIDVPGRQGHVAYPHLADNPIASLIAALAELSGLVLDHGNAWFQASNLEVTDLHVGNNATNVIPAHAAARLSIRFNDEQRGDDLVARVRTIVERHAPAAVVTSRVSGEAFLTPPGPLSAMMSDAITRRTGLTPELSTTGGTSDARFLSKFCPVVEFGLVNATMHQVDEAVAVKDLDVLTDIYADVIARALATTRSLRT